MRTLKGWIATTCLVITLVGSTTVAEGSVVVGGRTNLGDVCTEPTKVETKVTLGSTIIGGLGSILVGGFTSIIIGGALTDVDEQVNCGVIVGG